MTGRSRVPRRTPHSSSGNVAFAIAAPEVQHSARNPEYTHHNAHSNASLPTLPGNSPSTKTSPQDRIVLDLVKKLNSKLPYYSGLRISELEDNESVNQIITALIQLSRRSINLVVWSLCEILDRLSKRSAEDLTLDVLESEIYLVRVLATILESRVHTLDESSSRPNNGAADSPILPRPSYEGLSNQRASIPEKPIALDQHVVSFCLFIMKLYLRRSGPVRVEDVRPDGRLGSYETLRDIVMLELDNAAVHSSYHWDPAQRTGNRPYNLQSSNHSVSSLTSGNGSKSTVAMYVPSAMALRASSNTAMDGPVILTQQVGKVIHWLSATNWPIIFSSVQNKIRELAASAQNNEEIDVIELRYLTYSLIDKNRLMILLQELSSLLVNMKPETQSAMTVVLRSVVWNWVQDFTAEFVDALTSSRRRLEGWPERIYDVLHTRVDPQNRWIYWPTLSILLAISPDRMKDAEAALNGTLKYGKKHNNFLEQLQASLAMQQKLGETVIQCYNDICGAAFHVPPEHTDCVLRALAPDLADELRVRLINPPIPARPFFEATESIDIDLYAEAILNILRYHPGATLSSVLPDCLEISRSAAVKLCVVRALTIHVTEASKFPWQEPVDKALYTVVAPRLRAIVTWLHDRTNYIAAGMMPDYRKELFTSLHSLWRLDGGFFYNGMSNSDFTAFVHSTKSIFKWQDESIQMSALRTYGAMLARLYHPDDEYYDTVQQLMKISVPNNLRVVAEQVLRVPGDMDENKRCVTMLNAVVSQLADKNMEGRHDWRYGRDRAAALAVVDVALNVSLTSPQLPICSLAAKGLRLLACAEKDPDAPPPSHCTAEQARLRWQLMETIGDPKIIILGRVDFQKRVRLLLGKCTMPCMSHLAVWRELYHRWLILIPHVVGSAPRSSADQSFEGSAYANLSYEELKIAWDNLTLMLAATANACSSDDRALDAPSEYGTPFYAGISDEKPSKLVENFITNVVDLLDTSWVPGQLMCRDAVGLELAPKWIPKLLSVLERHLRHSTGVNGDAGPQGPRIVLIDQITSILKSLIERMADVPQVPVDFSEILLSLSRLAQEIPVKASEYRIKAKFCTVLDILFEKRSAFYLRDENMLRNRLLDCVSDWVLETAADYPDDEVQRGDLLRAQFESNMAALKTAVRLTENLQLRLSDDLDPPDGTRNVTSRLFHRYFHIFLGALAPQNKLSSSMDFDSQADTLYSAKQETCVLELVVTGVSNMLQSNTEAGKKHILSLACDDSARARIIFGHVLCRVLRKGTKFEKQAEDMLSTEPKHKLCEILRNSEAVTRAVIDACPNPEVDTIVPVLLNIFNTRRSLLNLLKMVVRRQVDIMENATDVFRFNDMCSRLFSAFARSHGYEYLRTIIQPLITTMADFPEDSGYEVDPSKLPPGQTQQENADNLERITSAFLQMITESLIALPPVIREVCRYIDEAVTAKWPDARHAVVGSFLFLRFIVPAIVSPDSIDVDMVRKDPEQSSVMRRGLLLVAKVIQSLANNVLFGKEVHMTLLNRFLKQGILRIGRFYTELLQKRSAEDPEEDPEEYFGVSYDEADAIVLYHFFQRHTDKIGQALLLAADSRDAGSANSKRAWDEVCNFLVDSGSGMEYATLSPQPVTSHQLFRQLMAKHGHRNVDSVAHIFTNGMSLVDQRPIFVFALARIDMETIDFDLLMYHAFNTIRERTVYQEDFDVIVDCTAFGPSSEIPISWYKRFLQHLPADLRQRLQIAYVVNPTAAALKFFRKLYWMSSDFSFAKKIISVPSIAELPTRYGIHPSTLAPMSYANDVESESNVSFPCQLHIRDRLWIDVNIAVGMTHLRITSVKEQQLYPEMSFKTIEIIPLADMSDIGLPSTVGATEYFIIRRLSSNVSLRFMSTNRGTIVDTIRKVKDRRKSVRPSPVLERSGHSDIVASLLNFGLFNICDEDESLRSSAFDLLHAVCSYLCYDTSSLAAFQGPFVPSNVATTILPFNERLAKSIPQITLDLINDFAIAFDKSGVQQRVLCLQYLHPWIKNLQAFANPGSPLFDDTGSRLSHTVRLLVDMSMKFPDVLNSSQRYIWTEIAKNDTTLLTMALVDLIQTAVDSGLGSQRCEQVADILIAMSSINVRAHVLKALRKVLHKGTGKATRSLTQSPAWNEISTLTRLSLAAIYSSRLAVYNQLFVPEVAHVITLLCSTGATSMRMTVYSIMINLVQSLQVVRADHEPSATALKALLDKASQEEVLSKFGLSRAYTTSDYIATDVSADQISIPALEGITEYLLEVLTHGAGGTGLLNVWRARWMSLVSSTAFQICPYIQYRAFVIMGLLAASGVLEMDDDFFYQIIMSLKTALISSAEHDSTAVLSILRCIGRVVPGLNSESRYLPQIFWLAVALLQSTYLPLYEEAARLLEVTVERMEILGFFRGQSLSDVLLDARIPLSDVTTQLDALMGLSFDTNFSISLASIIFRGVRTPAFLPVTKKVLRTLLRVAAHSKESAATTNSSPRQLDHDVLGYFLALLPFSSTVGTFQELLRDARVDVRRSESSSEASSEDTDLPSVNPNIFGLHPEDEVTPLLVISFFFAMLDSYQGSEQQKTFLFGVLAQLATAYPNIAAPAVVHFLTTSKSEWLLNSLTDSPNSSAEANAAIQSLFRVAMTNSVWDTIARSWINGMDEGPAPPKTPHAQALLELNMRALSAPFQFLSKSEAWKILKWIPELLNVLDESAEPEL